MNAVQGIVAQGFSGVNKCAVVAMRHVLEYDPEVRTGAAAVKKVPVCASRSVSVGDTFSVMQVGSVGVMGTLATSTQQEGRESADCRTSVQHAALVVVRPKNGSTPRCEVFTAEQMRTSLGQVAWHHSGMPPVNPCEVSLPCAFQCSHISILRAYNQLHWS